MTFELDKIIPKGGIDLTGPGVDFPTSLISAGSFFGALPGVKPWDAAHYNMSIGSNMPNINNSGGQAGTSNIGIGAGVTDVSQPSTGTLGQITEGYDNVAIGTPAMTAARTSQKCVAIGADSLSYLTTGNSNTAVGAQALSVTNGSKNTGVGAGALNSAATGDRNVAIGANAAWGVVSATDSTVIGTDALSSTPTGPSQTVLIGTAVAAFGTAAALSTTVAIGYGVMQSASLGAISDSVAIGYASQSGLTTGSGNIAIGSQVQYAMTTGAENTAIGRYSMIQAVDGFSNTAIGANSGRALVHATATTCVGASAGHTSTGSTDNNYMTLIGYGAKGTAEGAVAVGVDHNGTSASATGQDYFVHGTVNHKHFVPGLPTADPHVVGQLWANSGVVTVSAG